MNRYDELPFLVCHLTLQTPDGQDAMAIESPTEGTVAMLYGSLATTPSEMLDQAGASGIYFAFPDVSVRYPGRFRLQASLLRITGCADLMLYRLRSELTGSGQPLETAHTEPFDIVDVEHYRAPGESCDPQTGAGLTVSRHGLDAPFRRARCHQLWSATVRVVRQAGGDRSKISIIFLANSQTIDSPS